MTQVQCAELTKEALKKAGVIRDEWGVECDPNGINSANDVLADIQLTYRGISERFHLPLPNLLGSTPEESAEQRRVFFEGMLEKIGLIMSKASEQEGQNK